MMRLWQELLQKRREPPIDADEMGLFGRRQRVVLAHPSHSAYELAEPFGSCLRTDRTVCSEPRELQPLESGPAPQSWNGARTA